MLIAPAIVAFILLATYLVYSKVNRNLHPPPPPDPVMLRLEKWEKIADATSRKYELTYQTQMPFEFNPMKIALARRAVLTNLLWTGHAKAASSVMSDVDDIISTIEANHYALDEYGYGKWVFDRFGAQGQKIYNWTPNDNERFTALWHETDAMLSSLNELIEYVRSIAKEGVASSMESAKVHLQVHLQDFTATKDANAATAKELEARPL